MTGDQKAEALRGAISGRASRNLDGNLRAAGNGRNRAELNIICGASDVNSAKTRGAHQNACSIGI